MRLKALALFMALIVWGFVFSQNYGDNTELILTNPLLFSNVPQSLQLVEAPRRVVTVQVRISRTLARKVDTGQFQVNLDLSNYKAGEYTQSLSNEDIRYKNNSLPKGMSVLRITPNQVSLRLEEILAREQEVRAHLIEDLSPDLEIRAVRIDPPRVQVIGPRSVVESMQGVYTQPLKLSELPETGELLAQLILPAGVRQTEDSPKQLRVFLEVGKKPIRKLLMGVQIRFDNARYEFRHSKATLNVHLEGPREEVESLSPKNVIAVVDLARYPPGDYRGLTPQIVLPKQVQVLEQWPILDLQVLNRPQR